MRYFTLLPRDEIEALDRATAEHPERREAQQVLAVDVTERVHGTEAARIAAEVSGVLFGGTEPGSLSAAALEAMRGEIPYVEVRLGDGEDAVRQDDAGRIDAVELFAVAKLAPSKGAARRLLEQGGLYVNGHRLSANQRFIERSAALAGAYFLLRKGAREYALVRVLL